MLELHQKSFVWMIDSMARFSDRGDLVVDFYRKTMSVAEACLLLSKHRFFMECANNEILCQRILTRLSLGLPAMRSKHGKLLTGE